MQALQAWIGQDLQWVRPSLFQPLYELRAGDQTLATLKRTGFVKRVTLAESEGQQWRFQKEGVWRSRLVIYAAPTEIPPENITPVASMQRRLNGTGEIIFAGGQTYTWAFMRTGIFQRTWYISGPEGVILSMKKRRLLEISPLGRDLPETPLLALFSLYLTLIKEEEEAAAAG